jgi:hypothetical protein
MITGLLNAQSSDFIFLFDNSGSMSGYYRLPSSTFKVFAKALIKNSLKKDDYASVMLFTKNEKARGIESPQVLFDDNSSKMDLNSVISNFKLVTGKDGYFASTDLNEALDKGIEKMTKKTAVMWLVTDNINDVTGQNDSSSQNTLAFYNRLRSDENIKKIIQYPIPEKIVENGIQSNGYVIYGIVYSLEKLSQSDLSYYDGILRGVGIKQKAITLKPLDIGTVVLIPKVNQSKAFPKKLFYEGKNLMISH